MFAIRETLALFLQAAEKTKAGIFSSLKIVKMNIKNFTEKYVNIIHTDPTTKETFIRVPIQDYGELSFMKYTLIENLNLLSQLDDHIKTERDMKDSMFWISKILLASYPAEELKGIAKLIKTASKLM